MRPTNTPALALFRLQNRRLRRTRIVWPALMAFMVITSLASYRSLYTTAVERSRIAATLDQDGTLSALFGVGHRLDTAAGFAAWRSIGALSLIACIWGVALGTRVLRGDEEKGRNEVAFTGAVSRRSCTSALLSSLVVTSAGWGLAAFSAAALMNNNEYGIASAAFFGLTATITPVVFVIIGGLVAQLFTTRRAAVATGAAIAVGFLLLRMTATTLEIPWLLWFSPLSWSGLAQPFSGSRWTVVPVWLLTCSALFALTVFTSTRRDYGVGVFHRDKQPPSRMRGLHSLHGFSLRLRKSSAFGWAVAIAILAIIMGVLTQSEMHIANTSTQTDDALTRLGVGGTGINRYSGPYFLTLGLILCCAVVGFANSSRDEESEGRLDILLSLPVQRIRWLTQRVLLHVVLTAVLCVLTGAGVWVGVRLAGSGADFSTFIGAGINLFPLSMFVFAIATLLYGVLPRFTGIGTYALLAWSFVIQMLTVVSPSLQWIFDLSLFHYLRLAPSQPVDIRTQLVLVALSITAISAGIKRFADRDLVPE